MARPLDKLNAYTRGLIGVVQRGVREGLSIKRIGDALRAEGGRISYQTLAEIVHEERRIQSFGARLGDLDPRRKIDPRRLPEALTTLRRAMSFQVEIEGRDQRGRSIVRHVTVSTDKTLSPEEIMEAAEDMVRSSRDRYQMKDIESVTIVRGTRAGRGGTF